MYSEFVFLDEALPGIRWDAKYATADNFIGEVVDGYRINRVVGTLAMASALQKARKCAQALDLDFFLWDGYRPQRAVNHFLRWVESSENGKTKAHHYPNIAKTEIVPQGYVAEKSGHSRASTIDLTLYNSANGEFLDMGGDFDLMDIRSHHGAAGLPEIASHNRALLKEIMESSGFQAYVCEWWHYSLKNEPYPDTYFDFPIE